MKRPEMDPKAKDRAARIVGTRRTARCPLCDYTLDTHRRQRLVDERLKEMNDHMAAAVAQATAGKPGYQQTPSGLIVPAGMKGVR